MAREHVEIPGARKIPVHKGWKGNPDGTWLSLPVVGKMLRVSRQRIFQMGLMENKFLSIEQVLGEGERPAAYLVRDEEVEKFLEAQRGGKPAPKGGKLPSVTGGPRIPVHQGWLSLPAAGELLDVKRQRIFQMGRREGKFKTIEQVEGTGVRPAVYLVRDWEVDEFLETQRATAEKAAELALAR